MAAFIGQSASPAASAVSARRAGAQASSLCGQQASSLPAARTGWKPVFHFLRGHRPRAQNLPPHAVHFDDRRFQPVRGRPAIDDQRDAPDEFVQHVRRGRRADPAEAIRAGCRQRFSETRDDGAENRMRAHPDGHGFQSGSD